MTAYQSTLPPMPGRPRHGGPDNARTQRLRAHSKRAWDLYNGLMAIGELDRYYGPVLAAHIYLTRGRSSHTISQRDVARQANLPLDRVKDQMHRLEAMGMLSHTREGNRWRTTLLPFLPLDAAMQSIAHARSWSEEATAAWLVDLAEHGVRLPWVLGSSALPTSTMVAAAATGHEDIRAQLDAAQSAYARGDLRDALEHASLAVHALEQAGTALHDDLDSVHRAPPLPTPHAIAPTGDPPIPPAHSPALPPASSPRGSRKTAARHADRASLNQDQNLNRESESVLPPQQAGPTSAGRAGRKKHTSTPDNGDNFRTDTETVYALVSEGVYPGNVRRFADLPHDVVQAAAAATGLPPGHMHRAGRLIERLEAYRAALWQPLPAGVGPATDVKRTSDKRHTSVELSDRIDIMQLQQRQPVSGDGTGGCERDVLWASVLGDLARELSASEVDTWFRDTRLLELSATRAVIGTANVFTRDIIATTFSEHLEQIMAKHIGRVTTVELVID